MRIIAGEFRSRVLKTLKGDNTRPTLDKVRESLFHRLGPYFDGGTILDLYSGSGAISLEALSRGFDHAVMIEKNAQAMRVIKDNIKTLKVEGRTTVWLTSDRQAISKLSQERKTFDLIYLDPPYHYNALDKILELLEQHQLLNTGGQCLVECETERELPEVLGTWRLEDKKRYGISHIWFYRNEEQ